VARFYADEGFPKVVTQLLRDRGHDVIIVQEAGQDNQRIPDDQVLQLAIAEEEDIQKFSSIYSSGQDIRKVSRYK
jgi:Domain of unknown function (DUF5615)